MTSGITAVLIGVLFIFSGIPAHAVPHFTFTVPLRLANLPPEVMRYSVACAVTAGPGSGIMARGETIQRGIEGVPISGGSLNTEVVVNVTVTNPLTDPGLASEYMCSLFLYGVAPPGSPPSPSITYIDDTNTRFPLTPGAPYKQRLRGSIPR